MSPVGYLYDDHHCAACNGGQNLALYKKRAVCRYHQAGHCRRGPSCPFAHSSAAPYQSEHVYGESRASCARRSHPPAIAYHPLAQSPVYPPQAHPIFLWQPYAPLSPSFDPRYGLACRTDVSLPDFPDDKSDPSSAESSSTSAASMDCPLRAASWLDGLESGAITSPPGDLGTILSPGYPGYAFPIFPGVKTEYVVGRETSGAMSGAYLDQGAITSPPYIIPCQDDARKRPLAYKTKPCKFYASNGKCTSGERCTFIHDPDHHGSGKPSSPKLTPPAGARLPSKPLNKYDDCRARDFYPITWRVIGGGVMMGGQRQVCPAFVAGHCKHGDDCKFAHETELETDGHHGFIEPKSEAVDKDDVGLASSQQPPIQGTRSTRVRPNGSRTAGGGKGIPLEPLLVFPAVPAARENVAAAAVSSAPASPVHRRTRSLTVELTSPVRPAEMRAPQLPTRPQYAAEL